MVYRWLRGTWILSVGVILQAQGIITTVAGTGSVGNSGDGGPATSATLGAAMGVAVDQAGNIYIADSIFSVIRKVDTKGIISTFAGGGGPASLGDGGPATSARLVLTGVNHVGLAVDSSGNLYIADIGDSRIRKVDSSGTIMTVAGNSTSLGLGSFSGDGGPATSAGLNSPSGVAFDKAGNMYIADYGNLRIRKVNTSGIITTFAGIGNPGGSDAGDGGPAASAQLSGIADVAVDGSGNVYIADQEHIREVNSAGIVSTAAHGFFGTCTAAPTPVANADVAATGLVVDSAGNLYISDHTAGCVQELTTGGMVSTVAGNGSNTGNGEPATDAMLGEPWSVALDASGNLYIAVGSVVRKVSASPGIQSPAPSIAANGVVNGANFEPGVVSGSWATIQGSNLSTVTDTWDNSIVAGILPTVVDGVSVKVGFSPAYIYYVSPGQINFIVPPDLSPGPVQVTVTNSAGTSAAVTVTASSAAPAFFTWPNSQVVATRQDFSWAVQNGTFAGTTTTPAKPGDTIILWGTGFGATIPAVPPGLETPSSVTYSTATAPTVTIDNIPATVYGAALAPGFAGLYQVAIQVPASLANGNWPVVAAVGGVSSPSGLVLTVAQ
jgi:uncharacterized protein (TIGR03437 family)